MPWIVIAEDRQGRERRIFMREFQPAGMTRAEIPKTEAEAHARRVVANWRFIRVEKTDRQEPQLGATAVPDEAFDIGPLKAILQRRRR